MEYEGEILPRIHPPDWQGLPTIVLVKIFHHLSLHQRLLASSTCKQWRQAVFSPQLWPSVDFDCGNKRQLIFRSRVFARTLRHTVLYLTNNSTAVLQNGLKVLEILKNNDRILSFSIFPSRVNIGWPEETSGHILDKYVCAIETLCLNSKYMRHFSLGCIEELLDHADTFLFFLNQHPCYHQNKIVSSSKSLAINSKAALSSKCVSCQYGSEDSPPLESLHLASVKTNFDAYGLIHLNASLFLPFKNLRHLSLDYDYVSNQLLQILTTRDRCPLASFVMHVHSFEADAPIILDRCWRNLSTSSPGIEIGLNLLHSYDAVDNLISILRPSMPLTHFKSFFCQSINVAAINFMGKNYGSTLKSVHIADGFMDAMPLSYDNLAQTEDPFVMLAWKCSKLESITILGYEFLDENLVAIARLRGTGLKRLEVPQLCILTLEPDEMDDDNESQLNADNDEVPLHQIALMGVLGKVGPEFNAKISESLGSSWLPLPDEDIPDCIWFPYDVFEISPETYYLPYLLENQVPTLNNLGVC